MTDPAHRQILTGIDRLRRRWLLVTAASLFVRALFYYLLAAALAVAISPHAGLLRLGAAALVGSLLTASILTIARARDRAGVAKDCDDHLGLKDRLSSCVELAGTGEPMAEALLEETASTAGGLDAKRIYRHRVPREGWLLPLPVLLAAMVVLWPGRLDAQPATSPDLDALASASVAGLERFIATERSHGLTPQRRELLRQLERLNDELSRRPLSKKDALAELSKLMNDLEKDREELEAKKLDLEKLLKSVQVQDRTRELTEQINSGRYADAANRIRELLEQLKEKRRKLKEQGADPKELEALDEEIRELEEIKARLLTMLNVSMDIRRTAEVVDFLGMVEGEIGALPDEDAEDVFFAKLGQCQAPGCDGKLKRLHFRLLEEQKGAGKGTMAQWLDDAGTRTDAEREEHKLTIRETKGRSAFTQTQVANDGSRSQLDAREVLQAERRAAEETIQRQDVPAGYREYIRRYFEGIQPDDESR